MNTKLVNSAAGVILAALTQDRTAAGIALALESAQMLMTPETAAEHERIRQHALALEAAAYGDATVRLVGSVEQIRHLHDCVAAQMNRADTLNRLCREKTDRIAELEQLLAEKDRSVDEDPIAYALTEQAEERCDHPNGYGPNGCAGCGAFASTRDEDDVRPQVRKLRALLAGQRAQVVEPADQLTRMIAPTQALREDAAAETGEQPDRRGWCTGCIVDHDPNECGYRPESGGA